MSLLIEPEHGQQHIYFPGQTLRGHVIYTTTKQRKIHRASISFRGKIETEYSEGRRGMAGNTHGPRKHEEEVIRLFDFNQVLFQGPYDVPPQTFSWPFEFEVPTYIESQRAPNLSAKFIPNGTSLIPPTFTAYAAHIGYEAHAKIKYKLAVVVDKGGLFGCEDLELPITILRVAQNPPPMKSQLVLREFLPIQQWSSRDLAQDNHTVKQKFKRVFSDDPELKAPSIAFRAFVHFPLAVSASQQFLMAFSIKHRKVGINDPESPMLVLQSLKASLRSGTTMYAKGVRCQAVTPIVDHVYKFKPCELPLDGSEVYIGDSQRLADWRSDVLKFSGDFETYTVERQHSLRIEAVVRHPETKHQFYVKGEFPLEVLDPHPDELGIDMSESSADQAGSSSSRRRDTADDELPGYYDDTRPPAAVLEAGV